MARRKTNRSKKVGLSPGTPVYTGEARTHEIAVAVLDYGPEGVAERSGLERACPPEAGRLGVRWVDVDGIHNPALVSAVCERFKLHPLLIEDILNPASRPKAEEYDDVLYLLFKAVELRREDGELVVVPEQVSVVLGRDYVITFQELPGDSFKIVRTRILEGRGRLRRCKADYLAYAVMDATVDQYFEVLEQISEVVSALEQQVLLEDEDERTTLHDLPRQVHRLRQELLTMHRAVLPLATAFVSLQREERLILPETQVFLRDVADHLAQALEQLDNLSASLTSLLDLHLALSNQRIGEISKVLTVVATIFIPLTFIVGVYGMNFDNMPELHWKYGYFLTWGAMVVVLLGMIAYFRRQRWL